MDVDGTQSKVVMAVTKLGRKKGIAKPLEVVEECVALGLSEEDAKDAIDEMLQSGKLEHADGSLHVAKEFDN